MNINKKHVAVLATLACLNLNAVSYAQEQQNTKHPDYAYEFLGKDKCETFNRKMYIFNSKLNKYVLKPIHITWASIMPKYGMERIQCASNNIEYPKRLVSTMIQKDFKKSGQETVRFLTNTTLGLGGLYDPASKIFKVEPTNEDMEQALVKCKVKQGSYLVLPILASTTPRGLAGSILDASLNPSSYIGTPAIAFAKIALTVNKTSYIQPLIKILESTYADPYDVAKKMYGVERHIKNMNLDGQKAFEEMVKNDNEDVFVNNQKPTENYVEIKDLSTILSENSKDMPVTNNASITKNRNLENIDLKADINLADYNPQDPVTDSMRTALFDIPEINKSKWSELSIWNRCFAKKVKTSSVNIEKGKDDYKYRYILQKNKNAPVAIIYPSIGEGVNSYHSVVFAKLLYDEGYSIIIQGSSFQWEFVKSMPEGFRPGLPTQDAEKLKLVTSKIISSIQKKHGCKFEDKIIVGTSYGALTALFLANSEHQKETLGISKYISINPPIELLYAMKKMDKHSEEWRKKPSEVKNRIATTAAKTIHILSTKELLNTKSITLPLSEGESRLISDFIMHQKLSDLVFTIENASKSQKNDIYKEIAMMDYNDYVEKYFITNKINNYNDLCYQTSLYSISDFLEKSGKYKIYHTLDDYLVNKKQLTNLEKLAGEKSVLLSNGGHLGFLYRQEFINEFKNEIKQHNIPAAKELVQKESAPTSVQMTENNTD